MGTEEKREEGSAAEETVETDIGKLLAFRATNLLEEGEGIIEEVLKSPQRWGEGEEPLRNKYMKVLGGLRVIFGLNLYLWITLKQPGFITDESLNEKEMKLQMKAQGLEDAYQGWLARSKKSSETR